MLRRVPILLASTLFTACTGDAPLLSTPLPNGYSFESNGGWNGFVRGPAGLWLAEHFGMQSDGSERWCNEFGWSGSVLICRLTNEAVVPAAEMGYLILDTESGVVLIAENREKAISVLGAHSINSFPSLARRYPSTTAK